MKQIVMTIDDIPTPEGIAQGVGFKVTGLTRTEVANLLLQSFIAQADPNARNVLLEASQILKRRAKGDKIGELIMPGERH